MQPFQQLNKAHHFPLVHLGKKLDKEEDYASWQTHHHVIVFFSYRVHKIKLSELRGDAHLFLLKAVITLTGNYAGGVDGVL